MNAEQMELRPCNGRRRVDMVLVVARVRTEERRVGNRQVLRPHRRCTEEAKEGDGLKKPQEYSLTQQMRLVIRSSAMRLRSALQCGERDTFLFLSCFLSRDRTQHTDWVKRMRRGKETRNTEEGREKKNHQRPDDGVDAMKGIVHDKEWTEVQYSIQCLMLDKR